VARFRLRFLLQELDLAGSEVVIGRGPECQITIEDPLVSRQHARITVRGEMALIMDLGSRNGVRVNGELIRGETPLKHNDRVRLGTQDLVFLVVDDSADRLTRATGFMLNCQSCGRPFPGEVSSCPHCGAPTEHTVTGEIYDTMTGMAQDPQTSWTLQLLGEVIERALTGGRPEEAERMLRRAAQELDETPRAAAPEPKHMARVAVFAIRLAELQGLPAWADWAMGLYAKHGTLPPEEVLQRLDALNPGLRGAMRPSPHE